MDLHEQLAAALSDRYRVERELGRDEALRALERAYEERSTVLAYLRIDPRLAPLRDEPRFLALARRLEGE